MKTQISITIDSNLLKVLREISAREGETLSSLIEDAGYKYLETPTGFWRFDKGIRQGWAQHLVDIGVVDTKKYPTKDVLPLREYLPMILDYDRADEDDYVKELKDLKKVTKAKKKS